MCVGKRYQEVSYISLVYFQVQKGLKFIKCLTLVCFWDREEL